MLTLHVYEADWTAVDEIEPGQYRLAEGSDRLSAPGGGRLQIPHILHNGAANPALGLIEVGRIIQYRVDDTPIWSLLIEDFVSTIVSEQEEAGEVTEVTGRGTLAIFDKVKVRPDASMGNQPFHPTRWFNLSARGLREDDPDAPQGEWAAAVGQLPNYDTNNYFGRPEGFTDTAGPDGAGPEWLWDRDSRTTPFAPIGRVYGRQWFFLDSPTSAIVEAAADDTIELWIDNVPMIRTEGVYMGGCAKAGTPLDSGWHLIAWNGRNLNELRAGVVYAVWSVSDGMPNTLLARSDSSLCKVLGYPSVPPGFTATEVLIRVIQECQLLSRLLNVDWTFTADEDTADEEMEEVTDITCKAPADSVLTLMEMLAETYLDLSVNPAPTSGDHVLNAWMRGTKGSDKSATVGFTKGTCRVVRHDVIGSARATTALVSGTSFPPFVVTHPSGDIGEEVALDFGDASRAAAAKFAAEYLKLSYDSRRGITLELVPGVGPVPYVDFEVGDSIAVPGLDGSPEAHRVVAIGFTVGADSVLRWSVELDQPKLAVEERLGAIMRRQMPGSAGGRTLLPAPTPAQFQPNDRGRELVHTWQWDGTVQEPE